MISFSGLMCYTQKVLQRATLLIEEDILWKSILCFMKYQFCLNGFIDIGNI